MHYLLTVLLFGTVWLVFFISNPRLRSCLVVSGLFFLPAGLTEALFVPTYWNPKVIVRLFGPFDLESLFFAFFTGGIASALYPALSGCRIEPLVSAPKRLLRHLFWILPAVAAAVLVGLVIFTEISVIKTAFAVFLIGIIHMLMVRPDMIVVSLWGGVLFLIFYSVVAFPTALLFPQFILTTWTANPLFGLRIFQIPVDEFLYAFLFGGLWSTVYCGVFDCTFVKPVTE